MRSLEDNKKRILIKIRSVWIFLMIVIFIPSIFIGSYTGHAIDKVFGQAIYWLAVFIWFGGFFFNWLLDKNFPGWDRVDGSADDPGEE